MATKTYSANPNDFPFNKLIALVVWLLGVATTYMAIGVLLGSDTPWHVSMLAAVVVQIVLTAVEYRFFQGERNEVGVIALCFDVAFNAGGLYDPMTRIGATPVGKALADVFTLQPTVGKVSALVLALILGYLLARAPEYIWES